MRKNKTNKLVYGIGETDISTVDNSGDRLRSYSVWKDMISRCYHTRTRKNITYEGCSICSEWLKFSNFNNYYLYNYRSGYVLDKDIILDGNKIYSPETCMFVPVHINILFVDRKQCRGEYPLGVILDKNKYFRAEIRNYNKKVHLGNYSTPEEAHQAWLVAKRNYCRKVAIEAYMKGEIDERIMNAIIKKAYNLK